MQLSCIGQGGIDELVEGTGCREVRGGRREKEGRKKAQREEVEGDGMENGKEAEEAKWRR